ncbi:hypothetical protein ANANG_G00274120 [Anguilla anguilla]|uniref:Uncharacterized protein n=1 Tax=Anguilla anguilla TaxID=7936 RepID=A0A9D3LLL4_ANGAN|nr:hypothetical protein ANANG_G00274120 [Anguilla anguilla]
MVEVFLTVWPIARYVFLVLLLSVFVGTLVTDCITRGNRCSEETRSERGVPNALGRNDETSRRSTASEEGYYEHI